MYSKRNPTLRSNFLIHWTGKDINRYYDTLNDLQCEEYVERLRSTIFSSDPDKYPKGKGLWVTKKKEILYSHLYDSPQFSYNHVATISFTENKLSRTREHTERYGCLGFGFDREFVLKYQGGPVLYVESTKNDDRIQHFIRQRIEIESLYNAFNDIKDELKEILGQLELKEKLKSRILHYFKYHPWINLLNPNVRENRMEKLENDLDSLNLHCIFRDMLDSLAHITLFVKPMSECKCPQDFSILDESEWRIVAPVDGSNKNFAYLNKDYPDDLCKKQPPAKIPFDQSKLKILIFPDDPTRKMALNKEDIKHWLFTENVPIITTVEECLQF